MRVRPVAIGLYCVVLVGCSSPVVKPPAAAASADPIHWVRDSSEYAATARTIYQAASAIVDTLPNSCHSPHPAPWYVVMDADETLFDNSQYQLERAASGETYSDLSWNAWIGREQEGTVPGAVEFIRHVAQRCGSIAVVTNRKQKTDNLPVDECATTKARLSALFDGGKTDYPIRAVLCANVDPNGHAITDKNERFDRLARGQVEGIGQSDVAMYIGDSITDFPHLRACNSPEELKSVQDKFGRVYFQLPNPMYGGWPSCPRR